MRDIWEEPCRQKEHPDGRRMSNGEGGSCETPGSDTRGQWTEEGSGPPLFPEITLGVPCGHAVGVQGRTWGPEPIMSTLQGRVILAGSGNPVSSILRLQNRIEMCQTCCKTTCIFSLWGLPRVFMRNQPRASKTEGKLQIHGRRPPAQGTFLPHSQTHAGCSRILGSRGRMRLATGDCWYRWRVPGGRDRASPGWPWP